MRYLCFDIGDKRTGVALGDDETGLAGPIGVIEAPAEGPLLERMAHTVLEHGPDEIVVGLPLNMDGSQGPAAKRIIALSERLGARTGLTIRLQDERLTTAAADNALSRSGLTHKQKKQRRDAVAAAAILQAYLAHAGSEFSPR